MEAASGPATIADQITIARDERIYACFPDLARTRSGRLICVYRESDTHSARDFSDLVWRTSADDGRSWSGQRRLIESRREAEGLFKWNCPRVGGLPDGRTMGKPGTAHMRR